MNGTGTVSSTSITFYDNFVPELHAGQYTVTVSQALTQQGGEPVPSAPQADVSQTFIVRGPRFVIDPADVHRVFPPKNGTGVYEQYLPMIVLNKRALPWERELKLDPRVVPEPSTYPWMALLVFSANELLVPQPPPAGGAPPTGSLKNPTHSASFALNDVVNATFNNTQTAGPPAGTLGPSITLEADEDPTKIFCNVIDISVQTFLALMPGLNDLRYLSHVRQVSTENKVPLKMKHDGWFSAVIGNRLAIPPAFGGSRQANIAHLVSLEGLEAYLGPNASIQDFQKVRLISLCSWAFTCLRDPQENFRQLMLDLIKPDEHHVAPDLLLRMPVPTNIPEPFPGAQATVLARLDAGYVPLGYATRSGETTFSWYRGPLSPTPVTTFMQTNPESGTDNPAAPRSASQALIYEPGTGLFDQSYAVAFQTGRSLALASLPFSTSLLQWRRAAHRVVDVLLELIRSPTVESILQQEGIVDGNGNLTAVGVGDLAQLLDAGIVSDAFQNFLATEFADNIANQIGKAGGFTAPAASPRPRTPARPRSQVPADLADLMQNPIVVQLLQQLSGLEVPSEGGETFEPGLLPDLVVQWLAKLALLYGVPFNNLVANSAMLPVESIRFFYVDMNWIDALLDGAVSVGMQSSRDSLFHQLMRDSLRRAVDDVIAKVRDVMRGVTAGEAPPPVAMAGFVVRSAGIAGWPGLEVRAWSATPEGNKPMKPLRLDRVAPSVLIAIFPDLPVRVEFNEPSEGLVFGMEDQGLTLRYLPGIPGATPENIGQAINPDSWIAPAAIMATRRPLPIQQPPLDIAGKLVPLLLSSFPTPPPALSPASFALEMVRVPEQMLFLAPDRGSP